MGRGAAIRSPRDLRRNATQGPLVPHPWRLAARARAGAGVAVSTRSRSRSSPRLTPQPPPAAADRSPAKDPPPPARTATRSPRSPAPPFLALLQPAHALCAAHGLELIDLGEGEECGNLALGEALEQWRPVVGEVAAQLKVHVAHRSCAAVDAELASCYRALQRADSRWRTRWDEIELLVNPNGPLINGGSDGDNGQTGRKLVVDYYGPRVAIGGGALSGKDLTHIDRAAAYAARQAAVHAAATGAGECRVILSWAPNLSQPLDVVYEMEGRCERWPAERFSHGSSAVRAAHPLVSGELGRGTHFYDDRLPWNRGAVANYEAERAAS